jgi:hypothetical protein
MAMVTWAWAGAWAKPAEAKPDDRIVAAASFLSFLMERQTSLGKFYSFRRKL